MSNPEIVAAVRLAFKKAELSGDKECSVDDAESIFLRMPADIAKNVKSMAEEKDVSRQRLILEILESEIYKDL